MNNLIQSADGSITAFNQEFCEHYSSLSDGAKTEKLYKHIIPAATLFANQPQIRILDICFGLGYTAFLSAQIYTHTAQSIHIISLEKNPATLHLATKIHNLSKEMITKLANGESLFIAPHTSLRIVWGDAKTHIECFEDNTFDIVYQDPFSPNKNKDLWSKEHFRHLYRITKAKSVITTYSTSRQIKENASEAKFLIYKLKSQNLRASSIFTKSPIALENATQISLDNLA